jgi:hypothetical protein
VSDSPTSSSKVSVSSTAKWSTTTALSSQMTSSPRLGCVTCRSRQDLV